MLGLPAPGPGARPLSRGARGAPGAPGVASARRLVQADGRGRLDGEGHRGAPGGRRPGPRVEPARRASPALGARRRAAEGIHRPAQRRMGHRDAPPQSARPSVAARIQRAGDAAAVRVGGSVRSRDRLSTGLGQSPRRTGSTSPGSSRSAGTINSRSARRWARRCSTTRPSCGPCWRRLPSHSCHRIRDVDAAAGTTVQLSIQGPSGGDWTLVRDESGWSLRTGRTDSPSGSVTMNEDTAWRMYVRMLTPRRDGSPVDVHGRPTACESHPRGVRTGLVIARLG